MALARATKELLEGISTGPAKPSKLHLDLLGVFAEHGADATVAASLRFLPHLLTTREAVAERLKAARGASDRDRALQRWEAECRGHRGFEALWGRFYVVDDLEALPAADLSRAYNLLCKMNLQQEAEQVWQVVAKQITSGKMNEARELLGAWAVAPADRLKDIDAALASTLQARDHLLYMYSVALSRAHDCPSSKAARASAKALGRRIRDLSQDDLAALNTSLQGAIDAQKSAGSPPSSAFTTLQWKVREELLSSEGALQTPRIFALLRLCSGQDDDLWPFLRKQILAKKGITVVQAVQVADFLTASGERMPSKENLPVFNHAMKWLYNQLNSSPDPISVGLIASNLSSVVWSQVACVALLNASLRLRTDRYPSVAWKVFTRCADTRLVLYHPKLQVRMPELGKYLARHDVRNGNMPLTQMVQAIEAMRTNKAPIDASIRQMCKHFRSVYEEIQSARDATGDQDAADEGSLKEVQELMLKFWVHLRLLDFNDDKLLHILRAICAGDCRLGTVELTKSIVDLKGIGTSESSELAEGLLQQVRARLSMSNLESLAEVAGNSALGGLRWDVVSEVNRKIDTEDLAESAGSPGAAMDQLAVLMATMATWPPPPPGTAPSPSEVAERILAQIRQAFPAAMSEAPEKATARQRLCAFARVCATCNVGADSEMGRTLRAALLGFSFRSYAPDSASMTELAFHVTALHGGRMPLDVALLLWQQLIGSVLPRGTGSGDAVLRSPLEGAQLLAVRSSVRLLATPSMLAALRLVPGADRFEAELDQLGNRKDVHFKLEQTLPGVEARLRQLHRELTEASPGDPAVLRFAIPGTPYVVDAGLQRSRTLYLVPRPEHLSPTGPGLSSAGQLLENTAAACGWQLEWAWPDDGAGWRVKDPDVADLEAASSDAEQHSDVPTSEASAAIEEAAPADTPVEKAASAEEPTSAKGLATDSAKEPPSATGADEGTVPKVHGSDALEQGREATDSEASAAGPDAGAAKTPEDAGSGTADPQAPPTGSASSLGDTLEAAEVSAGTDIPAATEAAAATAASAATGSSSNTGVAAAGGGQGSEAGSSKPPVTGSKADSK